MQSIGAVSNVQDRSVFNSNDLHKLSAIGCVWTSFHEWVQRKVNVIQHVQQLACMGMAPPMRC